MKAAQNKIEELLLKASKLGYMIINYEYQPESDTLIIYGVRRRLVAYQKGKWFSVEEAKQNESKKYSRS
ncbi:MAG TPA: hypothetical protein DEF78_08270 [Sphingobacterium sp.]|nr:hypothetical protein [Sphingobacterium sp.]